MDRAHLLDLTNRFVEAFNRNDLDAVMGFFADDGVYDYYDETGKSAKKFLVRKPVATGMVTSGFGWR